ncbi:hypothetical protein BKA82DRAFT_4358735 [Pisolithus tinctorius]|nr:hypothetical protein BKA82DRAFT_4358735 [Pisolithus tinctorius]
MVQTDLSKAILANNHATSPQFDFAVLQQQFPSVDANGFMEGMFDRPSALQSLLIRPAMLMLQAKPSSSFTSDLACPPMPDTSVANAQIGDVDAVQDDPVQIWLTLGSICLQQCPGAQFNAWDNFFLVRMQPDESLSSLIARIEDSMSKIQELRPKEESSTTPYSIKDMDNELVCMALVHYPGEEYSHFTSSLFK